MARESKAIAVAPKVNLPGVADATGWELPEGMTFEEWCESGEC